MPQPDSYKANAGTVPGYALGTPASARSPMSDADFERLKATVLFTEEDADWLRTAHEVLGDQIDGVLDVWYGFVAGTPHLAAYFSGPTGSPDTDYLGAVRKRFAAWIVDTTAAKYDRAWLDYQYEIGLRHTRAKKNSTDGIASRSDVVHLRYMIAFIVPLTVTMKPFLARKGHDAYAVERMQQAWFKAVTLTAALWAQPYVPVADY